MACDERTKQDVAGTSPSSASKEASDLAPFNPSSEEIQKKALNLLTLTSQDVLFDLGCGDGRFLIHAAKLQPGLRCVGIDIDPVFVERGQAAVQALEDEELKSRLDIRLGNVLELPQKVSARPHTSISELTLMDDATALYLFVLPRGVKKLMPLLEALVETRKKQGRPLKILSYMFQIRSWEPTALDKTKKAGCPVYLYEFPPVDAN